VKRSLVLAATLVCALVFSSVAFANAQNCAHGNSCGLGYTGSPTAAGSAPASLGGGTLPFTGLSLGGIAIAGALLLISGLALAQRSSRSKQ
jgi:hypothetical protein